MKTVRIWCAGGAHWWDRPSQRGRRPECCPEHLGATSLTSKPQDDDEIVAERASDDGQTRPLIMTTPQEQEELASLQAALPAMQSEYEKALDAACAARTTEDTTHRFDVADNYQDRVLGTLRRIHKLKAAIA